VGEAGVVAGGALAQPIKTACKMQNANNTEQESEISQILKKFHR